MTNLFEKIKKEDQDFRNRAGKLNDRFGFVEDNDKSPENVAMKLIQAKKFAETIVLINGLRDFTMEYQNCGSGGHAYADQENRKIVLGAHVGDFVPNNHLIQVVAGMALHEGAHLKYSDWLFKYLSKLQRNVEAGVITEEERHEMASIRNIVEDCRVEFKETEGTGFDQYIGSARKYLLEPKLENWREEVEKMKADEITPRSICLSIIFSFFRCPNMIFKEQMEYELEGINPYEYLKKYAGRLSSASDAQRISDYAQALLNVFSGKKAEENGGTPPPELQNKDILSDDQKKATEDQMQADESQKSLNKAYEDKAEELNKRLDEAQQNGAKDQEEEIKKTQQRLEDEKDEIQAQLDKASKGSFEISDIQEDHNSPDKAPKAEVAKAMKSMEDEKLTIADEWGDGHLVRQVITKCPKHTNLSKVNMDELHGQCIDKIKRMRKVLQVRLAEVETRDYGMKSGKLSRRHLGTAMVTQRPFYNEDTEEATGISLCLLLDESGSMGSPMNPRRQTKARDALKSGYIISEALKAVPRCDMFAYSHTSGGNRGYDCIIKKLIHPKMPECTGMDGYSGVGAGANYDGKAIQICGDEFLKDSLYEKKIMIVISDGLPSGTGYGGEPAKQDVRDQVKKLEKKGIMMMQIGIGTQVSNDMFKHFVQFDEQNLVSDLTKMIKKLVLKNSRR